MIADRKAAQAYKLRAGKIVERELVSEKLADLIEIITTGNHIQFFKMNGTHLDQIRILHALAAANTLMQTLKLQPKTSVKNKTHAAKSRFCC